MLAKVFYPTADMSNVHGAFGSESMVNRWFQNGSFRATIKG